MDIRVSIIHSVTTDDIQIKIHCMDETEENEYIETTVYLDEILKHPPLNWRVYLFCSGNCNFLRFNSSVKYSRNDGSISVTDKASK